MEHDAEAVLLTGLYGSAKSSVAAGKAAAEFVAWLGWA